VSCRKLKLKQFGKNIIHWVEKQEFLFRHRLQSSTQENPKCSCMQFLEKILFPPSVDTVLLVSKENKACKCNTPAPLIITKDGGKLDFLFFSQEMILDSSVVYTKTSIITT
jgi:hypothetical protein